MSTRCWKIRQDDAEDEHEQCCVGPQHVKGDPATFFGSLVVVKPSNPGLFPKGPGWAIGKWQRTAGSPRRYCPSNSGWRVHEQGAGDFTCVSYRWLRHGLARGFR